MKGNLISAVDAADFKRCWEIRQTLVGGSIDLEIFRRSCKPDTDARAAGFRVSALQLLIQMLPGELTGHIKDGQPTEALLEAFAQVPFIEGDDIYVKELLRSIKRGVLSSRAAQSLPCDAAGCEQSSGHFLSRFSRCRHVVLQLKPSYNESRVIRHHPH